MALNDAILVQDQNYNYELFHAKVIELEDLFSKPHLHEINFGDFKNSSRYLTI